MAVMALASCVKEESVPQNVICDNSHERLTVYASTGNMSKTALDSEFNVLWSEGDKIKFVSADKSKEFTFTLSSGEGTTTGTFTLDEGQQVPADGSYIVYYPSTYDGSNYPVQKYLGDNVISGAPMKAEAKVENGSVPDLSFWNVGGILRYTIKGEGTIASINIRSLEPETPLDVTLDCGEGVTINNTEGTVFNIAVKPGFYSDAVLYFMTTDNRQAHLSAELFRVYRNYLSLATISNLKFFPYHEFVDFDLPSGRLWATCNLGADKPEEIGYYFYWGNIAGHEFKNNQWVLAPGYDSEGEQWNPENGNVPANATFDAARAAWDDLWRLPTDEEFRELVENTDNIWVENWNGSGMNGYLFTGRTDATRQIFLPAAGYSNSWEERKNERQKYGTDGYYHTSDMRPDEVQIAPEIPPTTFYDYLGWTFNESRIARKEQDILHYDRYMSIRPVYDSRPFYTVKFDANGHGTNPASQVRFKGELVSEPQPLQADGYDFGGWFRERYCSTQWNFAEDKMKESITLYAKWTEIPKFTVTFSLNGHGTKAPDSQKVTRDETATEPEAPSAYGYDFAGWFKEKACTTQWNFTTDKITCDTTLYAKWTDVPKYTATFNLNGHGTKAPDPQKVYRDEKISKPANPTDDAWNFCGWYKEAGCVTPWNFETDKLVADVTLYAKWTFTYVDLGLPSGNLWASCNLGAAKETDFGQYFTWGNADGVTITYDMQEFFDWYFDDPIDIASPKGQFTDEHYQGSSGYEWAFCKRLPATATYDAACKYLGQGWHIPSEADFQELHDYTDIDIEVHRDDQDRYYAGGWRIRSRKDPNVSIFIPFAGYCTPSDNLWLNNECRYWTNATAASYPQVNPERGLCLYWYPDYGQKNNEIFRSWEMDRNYGLPIRAVYNTKEPEPLPKDDLLPGVFTFNNKRVQFSKGNLWCDTRSNPTTSNFHFEDEQYKSYPVTNDEVVSDTHVSHFSWFETMAEAVKHHAFNKDGYKQNFIFAAHNFTVGNSGGWQMMSLNDWVDEPGKGLNAFVYRKDSKGRPLMKTFPEICGVKCAVYLPDDWDLDRFPVKDSYDAATWAAAESRGAVCFPLAGCHGGGYKDYPLKELRDYNVDGHYWTTDIFDEPYVKQSAWAICLPTDYGFHQWAKFTYFDSYGCSIRLVKEKK